MIKKAIYAIIIIEWGEKMEMRKIPKENYILLTAIAVISFVVVFSVANSYKEAREIYNNTSVMPTVLSEVLVEELDSYLLEHESIAIYFSSSKDQEIKKFEEQFKKMIIKEQIASDIVYVDTNKIVDQNFYKTFVTKYFSTELKNQKSNLDIVPNIVVFDEYKVRYVMYRNPKNINLEDVERFLLTTGVIEKND